ncbi:TIGR03364 family FAD-dependent oxidoreductase [Arthrobacter russicus]|uniref:FAD dependent oxidoreductase TIGR03364 n=1 Tax=Arthrobacter russicus TaxID=172040 RepID=A0ABU1JDC3_9MICC|nr:TIGR03364 family FAD-dependent oxidoreductase [Arthrobacter russicus]MDN5668970.1 TIGR03364 family FAD-dependent oxidoreductase [Renibacterium salmoninarum]MDR6270432.1 FAD dependent oxidoreductase TIGR03364 [Arthrobacter russicus]
MNTFIAEADLLVVGAGIIGLAHAFEAQQRGLKVVVLERDHHAVGASIRNFGHCCITAQDGDLLDLAVAGRPRWLAAARNAGFFAVESGALAVARSNTELELLGQLAQSRPMGQIQLRSADQVRETLSGGQPEIVGGAWLRDDLRVDPREAVGSLAQWLAGQGVQFFWNTSFLGLTAAGATTSRGEISAGHTLICAGHDLDYLFPELAAEREVFRCALQMIRVAAPDGFEVAPAVLTTTSMLRYPAFTAMPAARRLRQELAEADPVLLEIDANVMFTQRPDGSLLVGDSHVLGKSQAPFQTEATSEVLLDRASAVIGRGPLTVLERWQGVYAASPQQPYLIAPVGERATAVSVTSGIGMTISFGLAQKVLAGLS